jgi:hypothetical protein
MTRANLSGDCRMTVNNDVQASTHNRASAPKTVSHTFLVDLRFVSEGIGRDKIIRSYPQQSDAIIEIAKGRSII